jgi:sugar lactone lactonase YvrE
MAKSIRWLAAVALLASSSSCIDTSPTVVPSGPEGMEEHNLAFPDVISLPVDPDGIAVGVGTTFFVGDFEGDEGIYRGDLRTGAVRSLRAADGRPTTGLKYDQRSGYLFAARGESGWATVLDAGTGAIVADFQLAVGDTYVNDVVVTSNAAYFTESLRPLLYRVPLDRNGKPIGGFDVVQLSGEFEQAPVPCRGVRSSIISNGIEATPHGEWLIINSYVDGALYRVNPLTGDARRIRLGRTSLCFADGNLLDGHTLYVMQSALGRMAVVRLSLADLTGRVDGYIGGPYPMTTMARYGRSIYAVTAEFQLLSAPRQAMRFSLVEDLDLNGDR